MQPYPSSRTPSLQKMNAPYNASMKRRGAPSFSFSHLFGDPFNLATVSIGLLGWVIALVGSIISQIKPQDGFPHFIWWVIAYEFVNIVGVILVILSDTKEVYQVAVVGYLAVGAGFTTLSINTLIYLNTGEQEAAAVGFILLTIVVFIWMFHFGSTNAAEHRRYLDSIAFKDQRVSTRQSRPMSTNNFERPQTTASGHQPQNLYTSAQLNGFETSSPVSGYPGGAIGAQDRNGSQSRFQGTSPARSPTTAQPPMADGPIGGEAGVPAEYPYRAKAIYTYEANPDDANEISFTKHEVLEVSDVSGRWWQAKKDNGETGIAPSNYLILL